MKLLDCCYKVIYCDNRITLSYPLIRSYIIENLCLQAKKFSEVDVIAGVATAGIPNGTLVADKMQLPFIYVRSKAKEHGKQNLIEGYFKTAQKVIVIEDLISTGGSSMQAVRTLQAAGCEVIATLATFTYGFNDAIELFKNANIPLITLTNLDILLEEAKAVSQLSELEIKMIKKWRKNPELWSKQHQPLINITN